MKLPMTKTRFDNGTMSDKDRLFMIFNGSGGGGGGGGGGRDLGRN
jgi:hypothetical protein